MILAILDDAYLQLIWQGWQRFAVSIPMGDEVVTSFTTLSFLEVRVHCNERTESK